MTGSSGVASTPQLLESITNAWNTGSPVKPGMTAEGAMRPFNRHFYGLCRAVRRLDASNGRQDHTVLPYATNRLRQSFQQA
jgi:hypothetical protein